MYLSLRRDDLRAEDKFCKWLHPSIVFLKGIPRQVGWGRTKHLQRILTWTSRSSVSEPMIPSCFTISVKFHFLRNKFSRLCVIVLRSTLCSVQSVNKNAYQHCVGPHLLSKVETNYLKSESSDVINWNFFSEPSNVKS